jgi:hypothetical protein
MERALRLLLVLLVALGAVRMAGYLAYAAATLPSPLETFHLEAKMVLLAYRAGAGESLYPAWRDGPHVANFFGPVYFALVGLLGAADGADIPGLFRIGRAVTFASGLLTALVLGGVIGRRFGWRAGAAGAVLSLGSAPMLGFSVMVRPDLMAELLGLGGFFLSGHRTRAGRLAGGALLVLAILTKQTAAVFLLAAALASAAEGHRRRAWGLLAGVSAALVVLVGAITALVEPNFAASLMGESRSPWSFRAWLATLDRLATWSPDLLLFAALGLWLWTGGIAGPRDARLAVLTAVLLAGGLGLSGKRGADLNYYLSLRAVEALAVGTLWHAASAPGGRRRSLALAGSIALAIVAVGQGTILAIKQALVAREQAAFLRGPAGRSVLRTHRRVFDLAQNPDVHLLTDSGLIDLYQKERAAFGDPWLFHLLAETGQVRTDAMRRRVESGYYDLIITTGDLRTPRYDTYEFGLPASLAEAARARYVLVGTEASLFFYRPRDETGNPSAPSPRAGEQPVRAP